LADSPKADSLRVDRSEDRERVLDLKLEAATTGFASRLTLAARSNVTTPMPAGGSSSCRWL